MTLLSTLCGTHQAHYKLKVEKHQYEKSREKMENELWSSFRENTPFGGLIADLETAFSAYVKQVTGSMPGVEVCSNIKIRPDLSQTKFTQAMLSGKYYDNYMCLRSEPILILYFSVKLGSEYSKVCEFRRFQY